MHWQFAKQTIESAIERFRAKMYERRPTTREWQAGHKEVDDIIADVQKRCTHHAVATKPVSSGQLTQRREHHCLGCDKLLMVEEPVTFVATKVEFDESLDMLDITDTLERKP